MLLTSGFSTALSNPIGIRQVLFSWVVMPVAVLVLPLDIDDHPFTPTTPGLDPPTLSPNSIKRKQSPH